MKDYTVISNKLITETAISDGAYRLYSLLKSMCYGEKDNCYPSQEYLAKKLNKSVRTIQRYLTELEDRNLIKKQRRGSISNLYTILLKQLENIANKVKARSKKAKGNSNYRTKNKQIKFNNFEQRERSDADWLDLENKLLGYT
ncbi:helix-turn-helix domain-containing protein [Clostridium chrysemydis]|uniref:helix-turn-helix domain-containing protein n=1 Tax=Clostridium chrysemydis TaxID=2665504 RepID=UPI001883A426|nr:helix-turn-helix domain-containing protein [Clostridium chrysemydis]